MILLRDYQEDMIRRCRQALRRHRRVLLQAPTGAGKTALASYMAGQSAANGRAVWFICHRAELVTQTSLTFRRFGIAHGIISAGIPMDLRQSVQVCSIDTLKNRLAKLPPPALVIWDECHHIGAAGWAKVMATLGNAFHIGLSATPCRLDGRGLDEHFDELVLGPSVSWLIEQGHLSPYRVFAPPGADLSGVRTRMGDFATGDAEAAMDKPRLIGDAIAHWRKHADGLRSVAFATTVRHSQHLAEQFNLAGIPAAHLDGGTPKAERAQIIRHFADGRIKVLTNVALFGEGFDLSAIAGRDVTIDCVMQHRPTQSLALHLQQVGRAMRPTPGKVAIILDHAGNTQRHGLPDDDREWTLEGRAKGKRAANDNGPPPPVICDGCFNAIRRPQPPACPHCGKRLVAEAKPPKVADGDLVEIGEVEKAELRRQRLREQAKAKTLQDLVSLATRRGYKNPQGWAWKVWSNRPSRRGAA